MLRETDATGVLYFSEQLKLGLEAWEAFLFSKGFTLQEMIENKEFLTPIVHTEADFIAPLRVGDSVEIHLFIGKVGTSSFTLNTEIYAKGKKGGTTSIVHVVASKETGKSISIPEEIRSLLS